MRKTLSEAIEYYKENSPRGEYVLVVEGKSFFRKVAGRRTI